MLLSDPDLGKRYCPVKLTGWELEFMKATLMARRNLAGKRIVLTGATSGIGWYLARGLIGAGASVVVSGRRSERLERLRMSLGNSQRLFCVPGDLCDSEHRQELIQTAAKQLGGIDVLINNAGVGAVGFFEEATPERLRNVFELDFFAAAELTRLAIPHLKRGNIPAICNINSVLGYRGVPLKSEYCAAKFALRGWSESLRVELRPHGIDVLTIYPSTTKSEFFRSLINSSPGQSRLNLGAQTAEKVASSTIRCLSRRQSESVLSLGGKSLVWASKCFPRFTDMLLQKYAMA